MIEELARRYTAALGGPGGATLTFDAGQNSEPNFTRLTELGLHFGSTPMAAPPLDRTQLRPGRETNQPDRARLDAVLRSVLPLRAVSPPVAHQLLPDALDPRQVQRLRSIKKAKACWRRAIGQFPGLFAHWAWTPTSCGQDDKLSLIHI